LSEFKKVEPQRLDLRKDTEHGSSILEQPGEHGLAPFQLMGHRRKRGQGRGAESAVDPDDVHGSERKHTAMIGAGW
jgi:hypothetical protein